MSEKVIGFSINIEGTKELKTVDDLFKSLATNIDAANKSLQELNKQFGNKSGVKGLQKVNKELDTSAGSIDNMKKLLKDSFVGFEEGSEAAKQLAGDIERNDSSIKDLIARNKELKKALQAASDTGSDEFKKLSKEFTANDKAIKGFNRQLRTGVKETQAKKGSILDLREQLKQAKADYLAMSEAERNSAKGTELKKKIQGLDSQVKGLEESVGDYRRSVGNYARAAEGFDLATGGLLTTARTFRKEIKNQAAAFKGNIVLLRNSIKQNGLLKTAQIGLTKVTKAFNLVLKLSPIGLIVAALASLVVFLRRSQKGMDLFKKGMAAVNAVLDVFLDRITLVGEALVDFFSGDFEAANDKLKASVSGVNDELKEEIALAVELEDRLQQLTRDTGAFQVEQARLANEIAKAKLIAEDETKTFEERIAALKNAFDLEEQIANKQQDLLRERIILGIKGGEAARTEAEAQQLLNDVIAGNTQLQLDNLGASNSTQEELDQTNNLVAQLIEAQTQQFTAQKSELARINSLEKKAAADRKKANQARIKAEKDTNKKITDERAKFRKDLEKQSEARLKLIEQLNKQIGKATLDSIKDQEQQQIQAENERFQAVKDALQKSLFKQLDEIADSDAKIKAAFDEGDSERTEALKKNEEQRQAILKLSQNAIELETQLHFGRLFKIEDDAEEQRKQEQQQRIQEQIDNIQEQFDIRELKRQEALAKGLISEKEAQDKLFEDRKQTLLNQLELIGDSEVKKRQEILTQIAQLEKTEADKRLKIAQDEVKERNQIIGQVGSFTQQSISILDTFLSASFESDKQKLENAIGLRQESISQLEEDLTDATGLEKKFLQQQVNDQKAALEKEQAEKAALERQEGKRQQKFAITQALINGALAVTRQLATFKVDPFGINDGIQIGLIIANTAAQVAAISSQKFAKGGILKGASHANGGIKTKFGELEGGEAVINKRSTSMFKPLLSALNEAGGGKKFASGGVLGSPISAPSSFIQDSLAGSQAIVDIKDLLSATNNRIDNISVSLDVNNLNDVNDNASNLEAATTF